MSRLRLMLSGSWPTMVGLVVLAILAIVAGADWPNIWYRDPTPPRIPNQMSWVDFLIFIIAVVFLCIKNTIMLQRGTRPVDRLTLALVTTNFAFALVYAYTIVRPMFGMFLTHNRDFDIVVGISLRIAVPWTIAMGIWTLTNTAPGTGYVLASTLEGDDVQRDGQTAGATPTDGRPYQSSLRQDRGRG